MRLFLVNSGALFSVSDVYDGIAAALARAGHEVVEYDLTGRLDFASKYLTLLWQQRCELDPEAPPPTDADIVYLACQGVLERCTWYQPDAVLIVSALWFPPVALIDLRRNGYFVGVVLTESPYNDRPQGKLAALANVAWTNERLSVPILRQANPNTFYLPAAYDANRHRTDLEVEEETPAYDVLFVGTGFPERVALLEAVDWTGINLGLYGAWSWMDDGPEGEPVRKGVPESSPLYGHLKGGPTPNDQTVTLYRRAKIGLNLYRTCVEFDGDEHVTDAESLNPRAYELAACGVFTLSNERAEMGDVFGDMLPTFETPADLERLIRYYLAHDQERQSIAARLPAAVAGETFDQRATQIVADMGRVMRQEEDGYGQREISRETRQNLPLNWRHERRSPASVH